MGKPVALEANAEDPVGSVGGFEHVACVRQLVRHGLFTKDVDTGLQGPDGHVRVKLVRCGDHHHVRLRGNRFIKGTLCLQLADLLEAPIERRLLGLANRDVKIPPVNQ